MKIIIILALFFYVCPLSSQNQIHMNITNLTIYQSKKQSSFEIKEINGKIDTIYIEREGERNSPFFEAIIEIKNMSDSIVFLHPNNSHLYIYYQYENKQYKNEITFYTKRIWTDTLTIKPNENIFLYSCGYFIKEGGLLDLKMRNTQNIINFLFAILPVFKIEYEDMNGIKFKHQKILNVDVAKIIPRST